ncbi:MAG: DUF2157 domain-containing protein, partial [Acidimicrobiia bacterium]
MIGLLPLLLVLIVAAVIIERSRKRHVPFVHMGPHITGSPAGGAADSGPDPLRRKLEQWTSAGLITRDQSEAIYAAEHEAAPPPPRVPLATEAVGYVGSALVLTAIGMIIGNTWDDIGAAAHIAVLAVPTIAVIAAGAFVLRSTDAAMARLGSVLWALSVAGTAATTVVTILVITGDSDTPSRGSPLMVGSAAAVVAAV